MLTDNEKRALAEALEAGRVWIAKGAEHSFAPTLEDAERGLLRPDGVVFRERSDYVHWVYKWMITTPDFTGHVVHPDPICPPWLIADVARWLGYVGIKEYLDAFRHPSDVSRRLRNRLRKDVFLE